ncbi:MAG: hypothetical protein CMJ45_14545 [Planctomyces sp.]|nr:hypothetical protein [Planctomyces sp.]
MNRVVKYLLLSTVVIQANLLATRRIEAADSQPSILLIMVDDMGYSDLGCYGSEIRTPNLDQLASTGIRYTRMYNTSKCWTTRISLLTGLYHHRSERDFARTAMAGEVLRPAGYHTWWSGKHHAEFNPHERGFDHFSGFLGGAINFWNPGDKARDREPDPRWRATYSWAFDEKIVKPFIPDKSFYATGAFTDWALDWLDESKSDGGDVEKPFFLYMAYNGDRCKYGCFGVGWTGRFGRRFQGNRWQMTTRRGNAVPRGTQPGQHAGPRW